MGMIASCIIFAAAYGLIATEKVDRTIVAIAGAFLMLLLGIVPFGTAVAAIDFNVIFLLVGMMICVAILARTGFFEWISISVAKRSRGEPLLILALFLSVTALLSAFLDNVTTIILLAPVTILVTQLLEISPTPFLILEAIASNIGGTATLIGDPPNIIIGSRAGLSFLDFLLNLAPAVGIAFAVFLATAFFFLRGRWRIEEHVKARVTEAIPRLAIIDARNMRRALAVMAVIFVGFLTHGLTGLPPGIIALCGGMVMAFVCGANTDSVLARVEWSVIFFFIGLFMIVSGLEYNGVIDVMAEKLIAVAGRNLFVLCIAVMCGSALLSSILDNIPFVMAMAPMILTLTRQMSGGNAAGYAAVQPLWWSLALGACLGGNGTLLGASANVVVSKIGERNGYHISFARFTRYGFPFMVQSLVVSGVYIWLRYFF